jgi:hypothetical protein
MNQQVGPAATMLGGLCFVLMAVVVVFLIVYIFYLLTLQKALSRVAPRNRLMEPGMVWLMLVPCVNIIWQFLIAVRVPDSLRNEFRDRGEDDGSDYGKSIALTQVILGFISGAINYATQRLPPEGQLIASGASLIASIVGLALFVTFWVKIANYSARLGDTRPRDIDRKLDQFDDDDGYGRRPPRDGDEPPPDAYKEGDPGRYQ